jgi:cell shape-determining protein MreC
MLNRHLLDTNHQLRARLDEVRALQRRVGELMQENDMLRSLHRGGRR